MGMPAVRTGIGYGVAFSCAFRSDQNVHFAVGPLHWWMTTRAAAPSRLDTAGARDPGAGLHHLRSLETHRCAGRSANHDPFRFTHDL